MGNTKNIKPLFVLLGFVFVSASLYLLSGLARAQTSPGDFSINCQICGGSNNDVITCNNKTTAPFVDFTWGQSAGATSYQVYYKKYSLGTWVGPVAVITDVNNRRYKASVPLNSQNHYYIRAVNNDGFKSCSINSPVSSGGCKSDNISYTLNDTGAEANCVLPATPTPTLPPPPPPPPSSSPTPTPSPTPVDPPPIIDIYSVKAINITTNSATIIWTTNEPTDSQVEYCLTESHCGINTALNNSLVISHSVNLSGLTPKTLYHYWVKSRDSGGNLKILGYYTFQTAGDPVYTPTPTPTPSKESGPVISNVQVTNVDRFSATVSWNTDVPSDSRVYFCLFGFICISTLAFDTTLTTDHVVNLSGLTPNRNYSIQIRSMDVNENDGYSNIVVFKTLPGLIMTNVKVASITQNSVTVTWDTNYPADSRLSVCTSIIFCFFSSPTIDPTLTLSHSLTVSNLKSQTVYNYQAISYEALGYSARGPYGTFKTN